MKIASSYFSSVLAGLVVILYCQFFCGTLHAQQCANATYTVSPEPIGGVYIAGTIVEHCIEVTLWEGFAYTPGGVERIHGIQPISIGAGWLPLDASSASNDPVECAPFNVGSGWFWSNHPTLGWGWFYETPFGFDPADMNPQNNFGDANSAPGFEDCQWTFCWEMETAACPPGTDGLSLDVTVDIYSDGESGADVIDDCIADPMYFSPSANLVCCSNPELTAPTALDICQNEDLDLGSEVDILASSIPPSATNIVWEWDGPNFSSTDENPIVISPTAGEYSVFIEVDGCESISYDIEVSILPPVDIDWMSNSVCDNEGVLILAPNPGAVTGGIWSGDGISDQGDGTASFDPAAAVAGSASVTYELVGSMCPAVNTQIINVLETPGLPIPEMVDAICAGETTLPSLIAAPDLPTNFVRWYSDAALGIADFIEENNSIPFPNFIDIDTPGAYSVFAQTASTGGCFSDAVEVVVNVIDCSCPSILTTFDDLSVCDRETFTIPVDVENLELGTLTWFYPDGTAVEEVDPNFTFQLTDPCGEIQELMYELHCTVTDETEFGVVEVRVHPSLDDESVVIAQVDTGGDCPLISVTSNCPQFEVTLDVGTGVLPDLEYQIQLDETGTFVVNVSQMDADDLCSSHEISQPFACEVPTVKIPNAFSPNGDTFNDCFQLLGADLSQAEMRIFNRWGQEVYFSNELGTCWNGTFNGEDVDVGVYIYTAAFTYTDGRVDTMRGNVTLVR